MTAYLYECWNFDVEGGSIDANSGAGTGDYVPANLEDWSRASLGRSGTGVAGDGFKGELGGSAQTVQAFGMLDYNVGHDDTAARFRILGYSDSAWSSLTLDTANIAANDLKMWGAKRSSATMITWFPGTDFKSGETMATSGTPPGQSLGSFKFNWTASAPPESYVQASSILVGVRGISLPSFRKEATPSFPIPIGHGQGLSISGIFGPMTAAQLETLFAFYSRVGQNVPVMAIFSVEKASKIDPGVFGSEATQSLRGDVLRFSSSPEFVLSESAQTWDAMVRFETWNG
jgi:hypothetical protein